LRKKVKKGEYYKRWLDIVNRFSGLHNFLKGILCTLSKLKAIFHHGHKCRCMHALK